MQQLRYSKLYNRLNIFLKSLLGVVTTHAKKTNFNLPQCRMCNLIEAQ